jgi:hypothetical protein
MKTACHISSRDRPFLYPERVAGHLHRNKESIRRYLLSAAWFDGDDPLKPVSREAINETRERLSKVGNHLAALDKEFELSEPPADLVEVLRSVVRRFDSSF